jgi:hypothetical protein
MPHWKITLAPAENNRFCIFLLDTDGLKIKGPDGGGTNEGYSLDQLPCILKETYDFSDAEVDDILEPLRKPKPA